MIATINKDLNGLMNKICAVEILLRQNTRQHFSELLPGLGATAVILLAKLLERYAGSAA